MIIKNQPHINWRLVQKAIRVVESCETPEQLAVAQKFVKLVRVQALSDGYKTIVNAAQDYFILKKSFKELIENKIKN
jgi:hypothetical protein